MSGQARLLQAVLAVVFSAVVIGGTTVYVHLAVRLVEFAWSVT